MRPASCRYEVLLARRADALRPAAGFAAFRSAGSTGAAAARDVLGSAALARIAWALLRTETGWYGQQAREIELFSATAIWHHPGRQVPVRYVLVRDVAGEFRPQAFLCTDLDADPCDILRWFVRRWSIEVTFAEVRRHLGVETQRQWSDAAIHRTTPVLLGLFSPITLWADDLFRDAQPLVRAASWYTKSSATFSDAIASVRRELWTHGHSQTSSQPQDIPEIPPNLLAGLLNAACYPA